MKNLGYAENLGCFQDGARKQSKALGIIGIVPGRGTIERIAVEKWRIINKVELHPGMLAAADYRTEPVAVVERHGDAAHHSLRVLKLSLTIQGKIDAYLMTSGNQGLG